MDLNIYRPWPDCDVVSIKKRDQLIQRQDSTRLSHTPPGVELDLRMVPIDYGNPEIDPNEEGKRTVTRAVMLCKDDKFWQYLVEIGERGIKKNTEEGARAYLCERLDISSPAREQGQPECTVAPQGAAQTVPQVEVWVSEEIYAEDELVILHEVYASAKLRGPSFDIYEQIRQPIPRISSNSARRVIWDFNHLGYVDMPRHAFQNGGVCFVQKFCFGGAAKSAVLTMQIKSSRADDLISEVCTVTALARQWEAHPQTDYRFLKKGVVRSSRVGSKIRTTIWANEQHEQGRGNPCKQNERKIFELALDQMTSRERSTSSDQTNFAHQHLRQIMRKRRDSWMVT